MRSYKIDQLTMFGSKQFLIAWGLGFLGILFAVVAFGTGFDYTPTIIFFIGLIMTWTSVFFGPLMVMKEKGIITMGQDSPQNDTEKPDA